MIKNQLENKLKPAILICMEKFGIYIHWPFCLSKCPYCDFASVPCRDFDENLLMMGYLRDLKKLPRRCVTSVFFGGGTPSMMSPRFLETILDFIQKNFELASSAEVSIEANPDAIDLQKMQDFRSLGVNRMSLGVQALNETDLKFLGRLHDVSTALQRIDEMRQIFDNCSIDLMYARPEQSVARWEQELEQVLSFGLPHVSLYQLTIEDGTKFAARGIEPADEEVARALYLKTVDMMEKANLPLYEVSNFARAGFECKHNLLYWEGDDYAGIGPAAHGRLGLVATENPARVNAWLKDGTIQTPLSAAERAEEKLLMGLRLRKGMSSKGLNPDKIEAAVRQGWLLYNPRAQWIAPTMEGLLMLNQLLLLLASD